MKVDRFSLFVCCAVLFCAAAFSHRANALGIGDNFIVNGSFETGNFNGWSNGGGVLTNSSAAAGLLGASFSHNVNPIGYGLTQLIPTDQDARYRLSFLLRNDGATALPANMTLSWNGFVFFGLSGIMPTSFMFYEFEVIGGGGIGPQHLQPLDFHFFTQNGGWSLDDVRFVMTQRAFAVPEGLSGFWLLLPALFLFGLRLKPGAK